VTDRTGAAQCLRRLPCSTGRGACGAHLLTPWNLLPPRNLLTPWNLLPPRNLLTPRNLLPRKGGSKGFGTREISAEPIFLTEPGRFHDGPNQGTREPGPGSRARLYRSLGPLGPQKTKMGRKKIDKTTYNSRLRANLGSIHNPPY
jgi:hypothetical protein